VTAAGRQAILPYVVRLDDVELAAFGARRRGRAGTLRWPDHRAGDAVGAGRVAESDGVRDESAYLQLCEQSGYQPARACDLACLRSVLSTGSILYEHQYDWVRDRVKRDLLLQSISGGTDILGVSFWAIPSFRCIVARRSAAASGSMYGRYRRLTRPRRASAS